MRKKEHTRGKKLIIWICLLGAFIVLLGATIVDEGWNRKEQGNTIRSSKVRMYAEPVIHNP